MSIPLKHLLQEIYEAGWSIRPLEQVCSHSPEERYDQLEPQETLRAIARTQDWRSLLRTREVLRAALLSRHPQRIYHPAFEALLDQALHRFYFGDRMKATSLTHAHELEEQQAKRATFIEQTIIAIHQELDSSSGIVATEALFRQVYPKYNDGFTPDEEQQIRTAVLESRPKVSQSPEQYERRIETKKLLIGHVNSSLTHRVVIKHKELGETVMVAITDGKIADPVVAAKLLTWVGGEAERELLIRYLVQQLQK